MTNLAAVTFANIMALSAAALWAAPNTFLAIAARIFHEHVFTGSPAGAITVHIDRDGNYRLPLGFTDPTNPIHNRSHDLPTHHLGGAGKAKTSRNALDVAIDYRSALDILTISRRIACSIIFPGSSDPVFSTVCDAVSVSRNSRTGDCVWVLHDAITDKTLVVPDECLHLSIIVPDSVEDCIASARCHADRAEVPEMVKLGTDLYLATYASIRFGGGSMDADDDHRMLRAIRTAPAEYQYLVSEGLADQICTYVITTDDGLIDPNRGYGSVTSFRYNNNGSWQSCGTWTVYTTDGQVITVPDKNLVLSIHPLSSITKSDDEAPSDGGGAARVSPSVPAPKISIPHGAALTSLNPRIGPIDPLGPIPPMPPKPDDPWGGPDDFPY